MKTKITQNIKSIILALILVAGVSYVSASSIWTAPTLPPTGGNTDTPINVGGTLQTKTGSLVVGGVFNAASAAVFDSSITLGGVSKSAWPDGLDLSTTVNAGSDEVGPLLKYFALDVGGTSYWVPLYQRYMVSGGGSVGSYGSGGDDGTCGTHGNPANNTCYTCSATAPAYCSPASSDGIYNGDVAPPTIVCPATYTLISGLCRK